MKARLEFNLPEETNDFKYASCGAEAFSALEGIRQRLRDWRKHGHDFKTADEALDAAWQSYVDETEDLPQF